MLVSWRRCYLGLRNRFQGRGGHSGHLSFRTKGANLCDIMTEIPLLGNYIFIPHWLKGEISLNTVMQQKHSNLQFLSNRSFTASSRKGLECLKWSFQTSKKDKQHRKTKEWNFALVYLQQDLIKSHLEEKFKRRIFTLKNGLQRNYINMY